MIPAALFLLTWAAAAPPASVEGRVVNAVSGEALRGVHVRLVGMGTEGPKAVYGAISDQQGRFSMAAVEPGSYLVMPEFRGFVYAGKKPNLSVKAGERLADYRVEMAPRAVITGRVLDQYGDPVQNVMVQATPVHPEDATPMSGSLRGMTDDRGEYRLHGAPGQYHVQATPRGGGMMMGRGPQLSVGGAPPTTYGATWYPAATSAERAAVVEAAPGDDVGGIDIRLLQQRSVSVSGHVRGIPEGGSAMVRLSGGDGSSSMSMVRGMGVRADGAFSFTGLQAGKIRLYAQVTSGPPRLQSRWMEYELDSDLTGVELQLAPGGELTGKLEVPGAPPGRRTIRLQPAERIPMPQPEAATVDPEGAFEIHDIPPGKFRVAAEGLPENACVAGVSLDGTAVPGGVLDFSDPPHGAKLKLTVTLEGGEVSGTVRDGKGQPVTGLAMVYLARDPDDLRPNDAARTEDGTFRFKGICPGRYRVMAFVPFQRRISSPDDLKKLLAAAPEFEVKKGERVTRDVNVDAK